MALLGLGRCSGFFSGCGARTSHRRGFSCCGAQALQGERASGGMVRGPRSCSSWTLEYRLSSRGAWAYWIFPDQRSDSCLLHWQVDSFLLNQQGSPASWLLDAVVLTAALLPVQALHSPSELVLCSAACAGPALPQRGGPRGQHVSCHLYESPSQRVWDGHVHTAVFKMDLP